jgi:hypothetical protein
MSYFRNRIHTATLLLLALSLIVFFARGARRSLTDSGDFSTVYASTRCWLAHENPYLEANVEQQYASGKGDPAHKPNADLTASVYLPSIFPLVAPVAWLDWKAAERAWLLLSLIAFSISLVCVARSELIPNLNVAVATVSVFLLCSATHTGIAKGQPSVICISLLVAALYLKPTPKEELMAGLFIGLSCCIKPNFALPYMLFCCWRRQRRVVIVSVIVPALVSAFAMKNLLALTPEWWLSWSANIKMAAAPNGNMNPTISNIGSTFLVNFQTVIGFFTTNQQICNIVTFLLLGALALAVLMITKLKADPWQALSLFTLLLILATYHRYYDVQLLMLCINSALQMSRKPSPAIWIAIAPLALLWLPLEAIAANILPYPTPAHAGIIQFFAFRNQPLCLFALTLVSAWVVIRNSPVAPSLARAIQPR